MKKNINDRGKGRKVSRVSTRRFYPDLYFLKFIKNI